MCAAFRWNILIPSGTHRLRWEDNIEMDLQEVGLQGADWTSLSQDGALAGCSERTNLSSNS